MTSLDQFHAAVAADPVLQQKLRAILAAHQRQTAEQLAALSIEAGTPVTAEEILKDLKADDDLSPDQLEAISGGTEPPERFPMKIF
jgi:predicted ribosomally synthesized peptide with nif11-like leader